MEISSEFQEYLTQNFNLVLSLIIKSDAIATAINNWVLANKGFVDPNDPTTWKYYLNLSGQYSPYDQPIYINSLDNGQKILFSPDNLQNNPVTKQNYYPGSFFYNQLIQQYPLQQDLILSILYPVDIDTAISAKDGTILNYNTNLVEPQEYTLISELQDWIYGQYVRWNVEGYSVSDSYYVPAFRAVLYNNIVPKLINLRLLRCKTLEVHSFHLRQYLNSHNYLGKYINYLSLEQQLYLYRNISYFRRRSGFKEVFIDLIKNIAIPNSVYLSALELHTTNSFNDYVSINNFYSQDLTKVNSYQSNVYTLQEVLNLEIPLLSNNSYYINKNSNLINDLTQYTLENKYDTKIIYINNIQYPKPYDFTLGEVIYNNLIYLSYVKDYTAISLVTINNNYYYLKAIDIVYLLVYLSNLYYGINILNLPNLRPIRVLNTTPPSLNYLTNLINTDFYQFDHLETIYNDIISMLPSTNNLNNIYNFYDYCESTFSVMKKMYYYTTLFNNANDRASINIIFKAFFSDYVLPPYQNITYQQWLSNLGIQIENREQNYILSLYISIFQSITNYNINSEKEFINIINSVVSILKSLTSYTLQYITDITDNVINIDFKQIRNYNYQTNIKHSFFIQMNDIEGINIPHFYDRVYNDFYMGFNFNLNNYIKLESPSNNLYMLTQEQISQIASLYS